MYTFKRSRSSSHTIALHLLPDEGAGRALLDLGCSRGYLDSVLVQRGYRVTGVDLPGSDWTGFPADAEYVEANLDEGIPAFGKRFDYIVCADVLEHLKMPQRLLREACTRLAPGGFIVASLPNSAHLYFRLVVLSGRFPKHDRGLFDRTHLHFYNWRGWQELFESAGFQITDVRATGTPVDLAIPASWRGLTRVLDEIAFALARVWKTMFAYQFVVIARPVGGIRG